MAADKDKCELRGRVGLDRRNILRSGASLFALSLFGAGATPTTSQAAPAAAPAPQAGAKPNILFIMGDDIGWFNIGAYHRGIMAGKTPNLDKLAAEGMLLHRLLRRGELHRRPRELHHRRAADPHRPHHRRPGRRHRRHAGAGADHRHGAEVHGLRHRPVRQEPSRRPQRVSADGARLRRVLRLPLPSRRDGGPVPSELPAGAQGQGRAAQHDALLATDTDDPTVEPRWGKVGKQKINDEGPLPPHPIDGINTTWRPSTR